jgi:Alpha-glutamyl/putrescinyl thymine pyrophosphorylase clade 3
MSGMFCRHNRLTSKCPICSRELEENLRKQAPPAVRHVTVRKPGATSTPRSRASSASTRSNPNRLVTRKLARAADDGYRNPLVPGLKATADAERLAGALTQAAARLEPPGPYPVLADIDDGDDATWLAFLLALAPELEDVLTAAQPSWEEADMSALPEAKAKTAAAYRAWVERAGSQGDAFTGDESWTPERRFDRVFERLALPGFNRAARYDLLTALGAAGLYPLNAGAVHFVEDDATTLAAKRALVSGDRMLLERRAKDLAEAADLPIAALDRGLAVWGTPTQHVDLTQDPLPGIAAALGIR